MPKHIRSAQKLTDQVGPLISTPGSKQRHITATSTMETDNSLEVYCTDLEHFMSLLIYKITSVLRFRTVTALTRNVQSIGHLFKHNPWWHATFNWVKVQWNHLKAPFLVIFCWLIIHIGCMEFWMPLQSHLLEFLPWISYSVQGFLTFWSKICPENY